MKKISANAYIDGVESIYQEKPEYETGHDGSDGKCDCIGMCRGGLERGGATDVKNMRGTNQAARKTIERLRKIETDPVLQAGDVVLKTRDKDDPEMPLPDKYRQGGSEYDPEVGETNFTHIGTVTSTNPLEITHMTSPTAKKDMSVKGWSFRGELPWVEYGEEPCPGPSPEPPPEPATAVVSAPTGATVNMRESPSINAALVERVPIGQAVEILDYDEEWCHVKWRWFKGYMMTRFLVFDGDVSPTTYYTVTIKGLTKEQAENILMDYANGQMIPE
jgi:hypothetical protein